MQMTVPVCADLLQPIGHNFRRGRCNSPFVRIACGNASGQKHWTLLTIRYGRSPQHHCMHVKRRSSPAGRTFVNTFQPSIWLFVDVFLLCSFAAASVLLEGQAKVRLHNPRHEGKA